MIRVFVLITILLNSALVFSQEAEFSLEEKLHKFPHTPQGVLLEHDFVVTNTGTDSLIIYDYKVSCPCTKAYLPEKPIAPGESFDLKVTFDTTDKFDRQKRSVFLKTNTKNEIEELQFKVIVLVKVEE